MALRTGVGSEPVYMVLGRGSEEFPFKCSLTPRFFLSFMRKRV